MFDSLFMLPDDLAALFAPALRSEHVLPSMNRLHWLFMLSALTLAWISWWRFGRAESGRGVRGFLRFVFPRDVWLTRSAMVDVKVWLANKLFSPGIYFVRIVLAAFIAAACLSFLEKVGGSHDLLAGSPLLKFALVTLIFALVSDLATYIVHRASHEVPVLWAFHKLHHSAEQLIPVTLYRKHPFYDLTAALIRGPMFGILQAVAVWSLGAHLDFWMFLGANVAFGLFNLIGANLRHSHIWFNWGPVLSRIFISPAQHQIHHSIELRHHNRNYGELFALWDWMFGTLYIPREREKLTFGLADAHGNPLPQLHPTLRAAWFEPVQAAAKEIADRWRKPGAADGPADSPEQPAA